MSQKIRHEESAARGLRFRFVDELPTRRGYDEDEVLPAATLLRLPPRGAYVALGAKTSSNMPCLPFDLSLCSVRHLARRHVCVRNLTADIFYAWSAEAISVSCDVGFVGAAVHLLTQLSDAPWSRATIKRGMSAQIRFWRLPEGRWVLGI